MTEDEDERLSKPTAGAQRALGLAQLVNKVFAKERIASTIAGHAGYRVEMSPPEGMSTTSRKGAVDQLKLVPVDPAATGKSEAGGATLVMGTADPNLSQVELRTYKDLGRLHAERFKGETLPFTAASYDAVLKKTEEFFARQGIDAISSASRSDLTVRPDSPRGPIPIWVFVVAGAVLAAVLFFFLRSK